jgi:hypothetical protein
MDSYSKLSKNCKFSNFTNSNRQIKTKVIINKGISCRISSFKRTKLHQNSFKSLVKPTISLNLLVLSLILYKCLHFFNSILIFERTIKYKFNKTSSCSLIVAMLQHSGRYRRHRIKN